MIRTCRIQKVVVVIRGSTSCMYVLISHACVFKDACESLSEAQVAKNVWSDNGEQAMLAPTLFITSSSKSLKKTYNTCGFVRLVLGGVKSNVNEKKSHVLSSLSLSFFRALHSDLEKFLEFCNSSHVFLKPLSQVSFIRSITHI